MFRCSRSNSIKWFTTPLGSAPCKRFERTSRRRIDCTADSCARAEATRASRCTCHSGTGAITIDHDDQTRLEAFDFLDAWRLNLTVQELADARNRATLRALCHRGALASHRCLLRHIDARLELRRGEDSLSLTAEQREVLGSTVGSFMASSTFWRSGGHSLQTAQVKKNRAFVLAAWLTANPELRKSIVFVDDGDVADVVATTLQQELGTTTVVRYRADLEQLRSFEQNREPSRSRLRRNRRRGVESAARVVQPSCTTTCPLNPHASNSGLVGLTASKARGQLRNIIFAGTQPYEHEWRLCLVQSIRVFHRSVAPLQVRACGGDNTDSRPTGARRSNSLR